MGRVTPGESYYVAREKPNPSGLAPRDHPFPEMVNELSSVHQFAQVLRRFTMRVHRLHELFLHVAVLAKFTHTIVTIQQTTSLLDAVAQRAYSIPYIHVCT